MQLLDQYILGQRCMDRQAKVLSKIDSCKGFCVCVSPVSRQSTNIALVMHLYSDFLVLACFVQTWAWLRCI